jgi:hypothetical protein
MIEAGDTPIFTILSTNDSGAVDPAAIYWDNIKTHNELVGDITEHRQLNNGRVELSIQV